MLCNKTTRTMEFVDDKMPTSKKRQRRRRRRPRRPAASLADLPREILIKVLRYCDRPSLEALKSTSNWFSFIISDEGLLWEIPSKISLSDLPSELLLNILKYLPKKDLGQVAIVNHRFHDLTRAECLWIHDARNCFATNGQDQAMAARTLHSLSALDRVRVSKNWREGNFREMTLIVQNIRYMPRVQLEKQELWVSWGNKIWSHPRLINGAISRTTNRVLKGHTDDVARFVVRDGLVVSGGRDRSIFGWSATTGEFLFAKRYCHGSEVSAVDVSGPVVVSGSRDRAVKLWSYMPPMNNDNHESSSLLHHLGTIDIGDRIWSLAADSFSPLVVIGSAGLGGVPSLHLLDLQSGLVAQELGHDLKHGAGMLDLCWQTRSTFLSCGYDSCTRLWDTRSGECVRSWEEPFNESIYSIATDNNMTLVCGTARHGLVRLWDMRQKEHVQMIYTKHALPGQSSPVYSVGFDMSYLYVALDQCLSVVSFDAGNDDFVNNNNSTSFRGQYFCR